MTWKTSLWCALCWLWACGDSPAPTAPPPSPAPHETPAAPAPKAQAAPNPCDAPNPVTLELAAGTTAQTPWNVDFRFVVDEDKKLGSGFLFQLHSGERRWETRRDNRNWTSPITWRGFCWRGAERPKPRALQVKIEVAPVCKDGKLQELGGCGNALGGG